MATEIQTTRGKGKQVSKPIDKIQPQGAIKKKNGFGKRKRKMDSWDLYIHRVLKQINPSMRISEEASHVLDAAINDLMSNVLDTAIGLTKKERKKTVNDKSVRSSWQMSLGEGQLKQYCLNECDRAVERYKKEK